MKVFLYQRLSPIKKTISFQGCLSLKVTFNGRLPSIKSHLSLMIVLHWRNYSMEDCLPLKAVNVHLPLQVVIEGSLPSKVIFIKGHFPSKVFFHQVSSSIKGHLLSCQGWSHKPTITVWSNPSSNFSDNDDLNKQWLSCAQMRSASQFDFSLNKLKTRLSCFNVNTSFILRVRLVMLDDVS